MIVEATVSLPGVSIATTWSWISCSPIGFAILVLRLQQCRQQIVRLLTGCPAFGDDLVDEEMQIGQRAVELAVGRKRQPVERPGGITIRRYMPRKTVASARQPLGALVHVVAAQQTAGRDAHGDPEGLRGAVDGLAGLPALGRAHAPPPP